MNLAVKISGAYGAAVGRFLIAEAIRLGSVPPHSV
jgi:hypothetical protein